MRTQKGKSTTNVAIKRDSGELWEARPIESGNPVSRWLDDLQRNFGLSSGFWSPQTSLWGGWKEPRADISDEGDHYEIDVEMPGLPKDKIEVRAVDHGLEIRGNVEEKREERTKNYYRHEIGQRSYFRRLSLPNDAVLEQADAELKDGCLRIQVPKRTDVNRKERTIAIR